MSKAPEAKTVEEDAAARFQFVSKDLRLELSGTPEFVNQQFEFFRPALRRALGYAEPAAAAPSSPPGAFPSAPRDEGGGRPALEEFLRRVRTRVGRGALQERILLFIY